jgi:hypothetical protein
VEVFAAEGDGGERSSKSQAPSSREAPNSKNQNGKPTGGQASKMGSGKIIDGKIMKSRHEFIEKFEI